MENSFLPCATRLFDASAPSKHVDFPSPIAVENFFGRWKMSCTSLFLRDLGTPWHASRIFPQVFSTGKHAKSAKSIEIGRVFHRRGTRDCQQHFCQAPLDDLRDFSTAENGEFGDVFHEFSTGVENGVEKWERGVGRGVKQHVRTSPSVKVLIDLFQKVAQVEGAKPSSRLARREIPFSALSFCQAFSLRLHSQRKSGKRILDK